MNTALAEPFLVREGPVVVTGRQIRAARGMLHLTMREMAGLCGVGTSTLMKAEAVDGVPGMHTHSLQKIQQGLENAGIEFGTDGYSVRLSRRQS